MPSAPLLEFDLLLTPIAGEQAAGSPVPYTVKERLEELRKGVDPESYAMNDPSRPEVPQNADWSAIISLTQETLRETSKDLLVAARLTEALVKVHGFTGLRDGLQLLPMMVEQCWDRMYPLIESDDDLEVRAAAFNWLDAKDRGARFPLAVRMAPLLVREKDQYSWQHWTDAQSGTAGVSTADIERAIQATPRDRCQEVADKLNHAWQNLEAITRELTGKMGQAAPGLSGIREAVGECRALAQQILQKKGPAPGQAASAAGEAPAAQNAADNKIETRAEVYAKIGELAGVLQRIEPHSPIPSLLNRAVELGQLPFPELIKALILNPDVLKLMNSEVEIPPATRRRPSENRALRWIKSRVRHASLLLGRLISHDRRVAEPVDCTVFAPPSVGRGEWLSVQVFAHRPDQGQTAHGLAQAVDERAKKCGFKSLEMKIERGTIITFHLNMPGIDFGTSVESLIWQGRPAYVHFGTRVPPDLSIGTVIGRVTVSLDNTPIGSIIFRLEVAESCHGPGAFDPLLSGKNRHRENAMVPVGERTRRYKKAFISYASKDRPEVIKRVQMLRLARIRYFQDVLKLEPGDRWERKLYRHIDRSDLFLLFWSTNAKESEWVLKETLYAKDRKGGMADAPPDIIPVIIEGPPVPQPPPELADLHFDDYLLYFAIPRTAMTTT
jgi:type VI secretion system protein ImpA